MCYLQYKYTHILLNWDINKDINKLPNINQFWFFFLQIIKVNSYISLCINELCWIHWIRIFFYILGLDLNFPGQCNWILFLKNLNKYYSNDFKIKCLLILSILKWLNVNPENENKNVWKWQSWYIYVARSIECCNILDA